MDLESKKWMIIAKETDVSVTPAPSHLTTTAQNDEFMLQKCI